jgi:hypothetical protein
MSDQGLPEQVAVTTLQTLIEFASPDQKTELERRLEVIQELELGSVEFSPAAFLQSEVTRALGL